MAQTVLFRLMESPLWYLPAGSVACWKEGSEKEQWPLPACLGESGPSAPLDPSHFTFSLYATDALPKFALVLNAGGDGSVRVLSLLQAI